MNTRATQCNFNTVVSSIAIAALTLPSSVHACDIHGFAKGLDNKVKLTRTSPNIQSPRIFNSNTKVLPKNYSGIDPYLVWTILSKSQAKKDEYETTLQAQQRADVQTPYAIKYGFSTAHALPFVKTLSDLDLLIGEQLQYNADAQILEFKLSSRYGGEFRIAIQDKSEVDEYIGSNAYGATARVKRTFGCESAIEFNNPNNLPGPNRYSSKRSDIIIHIPATPDQAKNIKNQKLSALFLIKISAPYVKSDFYYKKATISEPRQYAITVNIITGDIKGILIFNRATGQVLGSKFFE